MNSFKVWEDLGGVDSPFVSEWLFLNPSLILSSALFFFFLNANWHRASPGLATDAV
jgi:hypothetical protein